MTDSPKDHPDQFDAALPLPIEDDQKSDEIKLGHPGDKPAAELIRKRIEAAFGHEPSAQAESEDLRKLGQNTKRSRHQQFIYELTSSGRPLHEIQMAWHEYYAALDDKQKHEVWQEFYATHARASHLASAALKPALANEHEPIISHNSRQLSRPAKSDIGRRIASARQKLRDGLPREPVIKKGSPLHSIIFGFGVGTIVLVVFLFSFFNERFIAPFMQPSRNITTTPIISSSVIGSEPEVIIPKINVQVPVIYTVQTTDDNAIETALNDGVVHYADTALPGQNGNVVIVGHSSNNIFNPGKYKFAFVLLSRLDNGDTFYLQKDGKRYTYQVYKKQIVSPSDVSVLGPADRTATATLITCDPPGTSINRLVVTAEQIDPAPAANTAAPVLKPSQAKIIPSNSPTLWSRFVKWFNQ